MNQTTTTSTTSPTTNIPIAFAKEYSHSQTVKIGCSDCKGCNKCCENMDNSIILDPYDMWQFTSTLKLSDGSYATYEILTSEDGPLELTSHEGLIMPNIKMVADERFAHINPDRGICPFLNAQGRCSIHPIRTGLCRLYPLGRNFYPDRLTYFILNEDLGCPAKNKSYVRITDWLEITDLDQYEAFQLKWHQIKLQTKAKMQDPQLSFETKKMLSIEFLNCFYKTPYPKDFYQEFYKRADAFIIQLAQNEA